MNYKLINTAGQITAVITDLIEEGKFSTIASNIMRVNPRVEQVGYLQSNQFKMMGGELSINGLIAGATLINSWQSVNGYQFNKFDQDKVSLTIPSSLIQSINDNIVTLIGITYKIIEGFPPSMSVTKAMRDDLKSLTSSAPAAGIIFYEDNIIMPLIYVPATNTYVWENACGSGSLATALYLGISSIQQPSGMIISINFDDQKIIVTTNSKEV